MSRRVLTDRGGWCKIFMTDKFKYGDEKMERYTLRMPPSLWEAAKTKSGIIPLSAIIRRLVEMWLHGEIDIDFSKKEGK